jgi:hypothetical protein
VRLLQFVIELRIKWLISRVFFLHYRRL